MSATGTATKTKGRTGGSAGHMRLVIGFAEYVDLPEWGCDGIRAKVDTGARTSALHVTRVRKLSGGRVRFRVVGDETHPEVEVVAPIVRTASVRSSTGHQEVRHFVHTRLRVGPIEKEIEVSLASRGEMRYRMLLGRSALTGEFLIDVSKRYTLGGPRKGRKKATKKKKTAKKAAKKRTAKKKAGAKTTKSAAKTSKTRKKRSSSP